MAQTGRSDSNWLSSRPFREWHGVTNDADGRVIGLYLWNNKLSGPIPTELGDLSSLEWLYLHNNQLTGTIPKQLGSLSNLKRLFLYDNQLEGSIPAELGNLSNLEALYLRDNSLTGCIPDSLRDVAFNDFDRVGLDFCPPQSPGAPSVSATTTGAALVRLRTAITVAATFSEPVNGFTIADVTVANGNASNFSGSDGDSVFTFDVTPNAVGVVTVDIAAGVAQDSDSNGNTAAVQLILGLPYDDDHDGVISRAEVVIAIADHLFNGLLTRAEVVQIIALHLFG